MSIFRCIDRRFETGEIFVKWDEAPDEEWLLLIYIKNNSPDEGIVIEDKTNPCLLYTSPSPRDGLLSRMPSSA